MTLKFLVVLLSAETYIIQLWTQSYLSLYFVFTSFFTLTNPLGTMPVFLTMTHGMTDRERQSVVSRATLVAFITIMVFTFAGQFLFKFFGISTNGFRIAGGVIIFKIGFDMLQARYTPMKLKDEEIKTYADDISITPLGIPMLCGPGAIANAIVLMQDAHTIQMKGVLIGMIAFIYLITFFSYCVLPRGWSKSWVRRETM